MKFGKSFVSLILTVSILVLSIVSSCAFTDKNYKNYSFLLKQGVSENSLNNKNDENLQSFDIRNQLKIMGLSDEFLNCISDEMMKKIIQNIGDYDVYDISYNNNDRPINLSDRDDIAVKNISIVLKDKNTDDITGECVCIYWLWKSGKPIAKQQDLLNIRWYNNDFIYDGSSFYAEDYRISDGKIDVSNTYTRLSGVQLADESYPAEISYYTDLQYFGGQNGGCAVFNLVPSKPMKSEDKAPNSVVVEYTHYYKTTIVLFVLSAIIVAVIVFICFRMKKSKRLRFEQAN